MREINEKAQAYLSDHPELYTLALERARRMGWVEQQDILVTPDWLGMFNKSQETEHSTNHK